MEKVLYWLWLTGRFSLPSSKITRILDVFESVEEIYGAKNYSAVHGLNDKDRQRLLDKDLSEAKKVVERMHALGGKIITFDDENYPKILKGSSDPPYVLYIKGKVPELDKVLTIGVVGTRRASDYGLLVTDRLCRELAKSGVVTISGMAAGIDAAGAWATLKEGSIAVGVIGSGIDIAYPPENAALYEAVAENGCIMTEYPPGTPPVSYNFPARNRIIAGLSRGVLVTEAPKRSGALITAQQALEDGRDVFAVPKNITDITYGGTNIIIQQGAKLVTCAEDILCEYPYAVKIKPDAKNSADAASHGKKPRVASADAALDIAKIKGLQGQEKDIAILLAKGDTQADDIARTLNISASELNTRLIMLEMKGAVEKLPGGVYKLKV